MKFKMTLLVGLSMLILASFTPSKDPLKDPLKITKAAFFVGSYDNFLREAKKQKKPVILDFWASWCAPCRKMDNETFSNPKFTSFINENFLVYKVNIDSFDGMEIADRFAVDAYPTLILLDSKGKLVNRYKGFFPAEHLITEFTKSKALKGKKFNAPKGKEI